MHVTTTVLGAGPAGLAIAAALAARDVPVRVVAPTPQKAWPANYGIWLDEAEDVGIDAHVKRRWDQPLFLSNHGRRVLARTYGQIDNTSLQRHLLDEIGREKLVDQRCVGVRDEASAMQVCLSGGPPIQTDLVIDATGARSTFSERPVTPTRVQAAWGVVAQVASHPWAVGEMVLMDFRRPSNDSGPATFLYALPYDEHTIFLEETSLAAHPIVPMVVLRARLDQRLRRMGIEVLSMGEVERCVIPMDLMIPFPAPGIVPFGAAASYVHPASGYSLPRSFSEAPKIADAIVDALDSGSSQPANAAWRAAWHPGSRRSDRIARFGLALLTALPPDDLARFLHGFFALPERQWSAVLSPLAAPSQRLRAMVQMGAHIPPKLQLRAAMHGGAELLGLQPGSASNPGIA
ncbi:MAG: lycopene cyclase family protein [Myxococcota bacterium]